MSTEDTTKLIEEARNHVEHFSITGGDALRVTRLADAVESLVAENEKLRAKLDMPCGSCHPCTQWANQTWVNAGLELPHVIDWEELKAERDALRAQLDNMTTEWGARLAPADSHVTDYIKNEAGIQYDERLARADADYYRGAIGVACPLTRLVGPWVEVSE